MKLKNCICISNYHDRHVLSSCHKLIKYYDFRLVFVARCTNMSQCNVSHASAVQVLLSRSLMRNLCLVMQKNNPTLSLPLPPFLYGCAQGCWLLHEWNSSPRPDGFGLVFFKQLWDLVKNDLLDFLHDLHSLFADSDPSTNLLLFSSRKKADVNCPEDCLPISLQNSCLQFGTKFPTLRLKNLIP